MGNVEIINASPECIQGMTEVENLSFATPWSLDSITDEVVKNNLARYICARLDGQIIGYGGMWVIFEEAHITNIAVLPEFRRCGIGKFILKELIQIAKKNNVTTMTLEVRKSNIVAQKLYKFYGFECCGIRKAYYSDNGEDAIIMWKYDI